MKKKMIVIDGNSIIHRAFHALPPFKTPKGELVNAVYGFFSILINIFEHLSPGYTAVAFDVSKKTFRHEAYEEYKAKRVAAPDELYEQFGRVKEILRILEIPIFEAEGFEADDVIATLSHRINDNKDVDLYIVTSDKDAFQLIGDDVFVLSPAKGGSENKLYDRDAVLKRFGLTCEQIVDFKALMGDASDNLPGVMGIGEKTATTLLQKYGDLDGIYEHIDEIGGALHKKLAGGREDAYFSKKMVTLRFDVPIDFDLEALEFEIGHWQRAIGIFEELNFKSLIGRVRKLLGVKPKAGPVQTSIF